MAPSSNFWRGKRVLLTGHTGFKGAWAARRLTRLGARVTGLSLAPQTDPNLHTLLKTAVDAEYMCDIRDEAAVRRTTLAARPNIVLHLAAQALVPQSYRDPVGTFAANVMGTIHLLEALRGQHDVEATVIVTTDKVYANDERAHSFVETDPLGGDDPYSASKAAAEIATHAWSKSFAKGAGRIGTARAGNVIGGGDWSADRLVPDIVRAAETGRQLVLRRPEAVRPWQHVLDPIDGYLMYAEALATCQAVPASLNFGPCDGVQLTVGAVAGQLMAALASGTMSPPGWRHEPEPGIGEKATLALDASAAKAMLGWRAKLSTRLALDWTVAWYKGLHQGDDAAALTDAQIAAFEALPANNADS